MTGSATELYYFRQKEQKCYSEISRGADFFIKD